jgi:acyl carrier protein
VNPAAIESQLKQVLTNRLGVPAEEITLAARLTADLGMDSLDAMELAIATERHFGVTISDEQIGGLETVGDVVALIRQLSEDQAACPPATKPPR